MRLNYEEVDNSPQLIYQVNMELYETQADITTYYKPLHFTV